MPRFVTNETMNLPRSPSPAELGAFAVGNLGDRIFRAPGIGRGHVVDWISLFGPRGEHWPIFNLADSAIVTGGLLAYFSAEFGIHESLPIYSGGLGVLSGDHVKSASDLGVPLVGVGLFYAQGYFRQRLDSSGWQSEDYLAVDVKHLPLELLIGRDHQPVTVTIETRGPAISRPAN